MSKLNPVGISTNNGRAVSGNGNVQFKKNAEQVLYEIAVSMLYGKEQNYYEPQAATLTRLAEAVRDVVKKGNLDFVANVIIHARTEMNIRTAPILLVGLFAKALREQKKSYPKMRQLVCDVIQRADQITDMLAVSRMLFGVEKIKGDANTICLRHMPMAIKRGIADAFNKFNEYALAKYNRDGAIKLRDALRIVHPSPKNAAQGVLFEKLMKDELQVPYTWETRLSANGQLPEAERKSKKDIWSELVTSGEVGYMALLRNLRNICEAGVNAEVERQYVADVIADKANVLKSKQFPYAFLNAYDAAKPVASSRVLSSISEALDHSFANLPVIGENVWIIIDCSGSMGGGWGSNSPNPPIKTACLFAAALAKANKNSRNVKLTMFSDSAKHVAINTSDSIMTSTERLIAEVYGGGTNLAAALGKKSTLGFEPDTVIVLSDMEVNQLSGGTVPASFAEGAIKIAINLNSRDSTPIGEKNGWYQLAGWSEKLFDFIPAMREGQTIVQKLSVPYIGVKKRAKPVEVVEA